MILLIGDKRYMEVGNMEIGIAVKVPKGKRLPRNVDHLYIDFHDELEAQQFAKALHRLHPELILSIVRQIEFDF